MKLSLQADEFSPQPAPFIAFARMGEIVRENSLYGDRTLGMNGTHLRNIATATAREDAEAAIDRLEAGVRNAHGREARQSFRDALSMAKHSENPHQLHYLASMFINHPNVIREIAKNPHIETRTQLAVLDDSVLGQDVRLQRNLGDNPAIGPEVMTRLLNNSEDSITHYAVTRNAVRKSLQSNGPDTPYVKICDMLADTSRDPALRLAALAGVRDHSVMRKIVRTRDAVFGARELEAIAGNIHAPKDVLAEMANASGPRQAEHAAFGAAIGQRAALTLARLSHPEMDNDAVRRS
ncbi:hypothetical protein FAZ69_08345 [Trinickia terrae]|uniref:Uncharacterized protein n=1 Tax=Trinickia terrae TaxID=2571161 RepID=A0A4U1I9I1_9BURK|nr:hypothetical protein [Trinickia terrae]TKC90148.1 hypothetical protein FAZ69_08345 [Trinickia terrae]